MILILSVLISSSSDKLISVSVTSIYVQAYFYKVQQNVDQALEEVQLFR